MPSSPHLLYTLSIVSHGQAALVRDLLWDLERLPRDDFEVVLTLNIPEDETGLLPRPFPIRVLRNSRRLGFGANHNGAFVQSQGQYFAVINPDIRAADLDLDALSNAIEEDGVGACAPLVVDRDGHIEDSARKFPTWGRLLRKALLGERTRDYEFKADVCDVDWVAGMFIVLRRQAYDEVRGFDSQRFFMYYEDVDLCQRLHRLGWRVVLQPATRVVHHAQRASHRNLQHFLWHATSVLRFLTKW